jgi:phosphatidylserine/phosphatidylglycerophosphate/cardiolipin synthase-like enzyme
MRRCAARSAASNQALLPHYSGVTFTANAGLPVWIDAHIRNAHNKLIIIDQHLVVGGSFNFSAAAQARNVENVTFIDSTSGCRELVSCQLDIAARCVLPLCAGRGIAGASGGCCRPP